MQPKVNPMEGWGLWDVANIRVEYVSRNWVQFSIKHRVINGETAHVNIYYTLLDRIRGVDFDEKVRNSLDKFIRKYKAKNREIEYLREKEKLLR